MNKTEVIATIRTARAHFLGLMSELCGKEFAAGYHRATEDMIRLFDKAPIDADFDAERKALITEVERLKAENERLEQDVCEKHATIQKLLSHVNISEVLGVDVGRKPKAGRRVTVFTFR